MKDSLLSSPKNSSRYTICCIRIPHLLLGGPVSHEDICGGYKTVEKNVNK